MEYQEIQNKVKEILPEKRYEHTLRVVEVAKHLAEIHGASVEKAALAALVHDVCKPMDEVLMKKYVILHNLDVNLLDYPVEVLHGPVASAYIEEEFGVADEEVKLAVANHTFGRKHMTLLECYNYYNIKNYRVGFKEKNKDKILTEEKTITIRNKSEAHFKKGDLLEATTYEDPDTVFATLEVDLVKPVTRETLTERYAKYYGVTLDELIEKLAKRYPEDEVLYVVMFHIIKK